MCRYFIFLWTFIIYGLSTSIYALGDDAAQAFISSSQQAKIISVSLEENFIILNNITYKIHSKIQVSNYQNLPVDPGSLVPGQKIEFWTDTQHLNNNLPSGSHNANVIKIRILSDVSHESIYH